MSKSKLAYLGLGLSLVGIPVALITWLIPSSTVLYGWRFGVFVVSVVLAIVGIVFLVMAFWPTKTGRQGSTTSPSPFITTYMHDDTKIEAHMATVSQTTPTGTRQTVIGPGQVSVKTIPKKPESKEPCPYCGAREWWLLGTQAVLPSTLSSTYVPKAYNLDQYQCKACGRSHQETRHS